MKAKITSAIVFAATLIAGSGLADTVKWDMASEFQNTSIHGQAQQVFADTVFEVSDGSIEITNHFGGSIGYKSREHFDVVADGTLQIANTSMGQVAQIEPIFLLSSLPFLVGNMKEANLLWEMAKPAYEEAFARNNQILLYASPWPPAGIWAKQSVDSTEDLKGLKIRAWDASGTTTLKGAGAIAIQTSWADVVPQLATGRIDAVLTSAESGTNGKFWDQGLTHFSAVNYSMSLNMTHVNKDAWNALNNDQRSALMKAAQVASKVAWGALTNRVAENYVEMKANGITVIDPVPDDFLAALSAVGEDVYADWIVKVGEVGQKILDDYRAARTN